MKVEINSDAPHPNLPPQGREGERDQPSPTREGRRKRLAFPHKGGEEDEINLSPQGTEGERDQSSPARELEETLILIKASYRICRFIPKLRQRRYQ